MNKKLIKALVAASISISATIQVAPMAQANSVPVIAILDTALDTSLPIFKDRVIHEVCILEWNSCPNGTSFMEGPGSAVLPLNIMSSNGFDHGTQMASIAVDLNSKIEIVFIRIIGSTAYGNRQPTGETTVNNALNWVLKNKDKYNIKSVAMSQGHHNLGPVGTDYCPSTPNTKNLLASLASSGVATFFPAGNSRDYARLDWPACITESISIGWVDQNLNISPNGNFDKNKLDFYALGDARVLVPGGGFKNTAGSSISVQVAATTWALLKNKYPIYTNDQIFDLLSQTSTKVSGTNGQFGKLINVYMSLNTNLEQLSSQTVIDQTKIVEETNKYIALVKEEYEKNIPSIDKKIVAIKKKRTNKING